MAMTSGVTIFDSTLTVLRVLRERDRDLGPPLGPVPASTLANWQPADAGDRLLFADDPEGLHLFRQHERRAGVLPPWTALH